MIPNYIFSHINIIAFIVWSIFFTVLLVRFLWPVKVKNISYSWFVGGAVVLHVVYAVFITWGQYHVWGSGGAVTNFLISAPLSAEAPLPSIIEWTRPFWNHSLGYFAYYSLWHFWLNIIELFVVAGLIYLVLKLWDFYRGGFMPHGPEIILITLLISGFPGALMLVPLGFVLALMWFGGLAVADYIKYRSWKSHNMNIETFFIAAIPITFAIRTFLNF